MSSADAFHHRSPPHSSQGKSTGETLLQPISRPNPTPLFQELSCPFMQSCGGTVATEPLSSYIDEYLGDCYGLSPETQRLYQTHLDRLLKTVGDIPITEVDTKVLRKYMADLRRQDGRKYSASYLDQVYRTLHTFFEWLVRERVLMENPITRGRRVKVPKRKSPRLTLEDFDQLIDAVEQNEHAERNLAIVSLMVGSGLRRGEVFALRVSDIDPENEVVHPFGKDKEEREIPLGVETVEALRAYLEVRPDSTSDQLFVKANGEPLTLNGLVSVIRRLQDLSGLPKLNVKGSSPFTRSR